MFSFVRLGKNMLWSYLDQQQIEGSVKCGVGINVINKRASLRDLYRKAQITADNKIYLLRSLRCRGSSRARPYAPEDRGQSTSGTLVLCFAARRSGHIW